MTAAVVHQLSGGFTAERVLAGHAYPRSGNAHNPTPRYRYEVRNDEGRRIGTVSTLSSARELAAEAAQEVPE